MNSPVPAWLEKLLGIPSEAGEGTVWSLEHAWHWPPWVTLVFTLAAAIFVFSIYLREDRQAPRLLRLVLAVNRLVLVAIVLLMIAQFALGLQRTGLPYVAVVVDDSLSMTVVDRYEEAVRRALAARLEAAGVKEASRWNLARTVLTEKDGRLLRSLARDYKLRVYFLSDEAAGARASRDLEPGAILDEIKTLEPSAASTRLGAAVQMVLDDLRGTTPAALVLVTDGVNTEGLSLADAALSARRRGVPLFAVGLGDEQPVRDVRLSDLLVEEVVFVNDVVTFEAGLSASGYAGREVRVTLRRQDKPDVLAETKVKLAADGQPQQVRLTYRPTEEGEISFMVAAEPLEGELDTANNRQERTVRVRKEQIRVLLAQAYPSYEYRYLATMLRRDETIKLDTVLQEADPEYVQEGGTTLPSFPVRREELFQYDVVILGDVDPALLTAGIMQNVADFVEQPGKGGALVLIAGPRYMPLAFRDTPLARLVPVNLAMARAPEPGKPVTEGFQIRPTELGLASPQMQLGNTPAETEEIWGRLAPVYWLFEAPELKPAARVLAEHPTRVGSNGQPLPVMALQYVGAGKVLFHASDETWRWRWRTGDVYFARYWVQTIRYLARAKLFEGSRAALVTADRRQYRRGESARLRVRFTDESAAPAEDDGVTVLVERKGQKIERVKLRRVGAERGLFEATLGRLQIGEYHLSVAVPRLEGRPPAADFTVVAPPGEFERVEMDAAALKAAAEQTKGRFYTFATADHLLGDLPAGRQVPVEALPPRPLWSSWPVLALFLGLLIMEWILRKLGGMI